MGLVVEEKYSSSYYQRVMDNSERTPSHLASKYVDY